MKLPSLRFLALALILTAASMLGATAAHAQIGTPQSPYVITSAPYKITKPGYYILGNSLNYTGTSGNIIEVTASNVTLDFNSFYIAGAVGNSSQTTVGIRAYEQANLTIKNGTIAYCKTGISLEGDLTPTTNAIDAAVDNMRVTYCYFIGIQTYACPASTISNCKVSQIGYSGQDYAYGIYCFGGSSTIQNNVVTNVVGYNGSGIYVYNSFALRNTISFASYGVYSVYGGKYQDNLTLNCTTPFSGGTDAGGNN